MKGYIALLCLVAAVQGRTWDADGARFTGSLAELGENPWVVHLRVTKSTGEGRLESCVGSLVSSTWVLTAASCVQNARFIWIRYAALDPARPELVTETSTVQINPGYNAATGANNLALVHINRIVETSDNIKYIAMALAAADGEAAPVRGRFCSYRGRYDDPREVLQCFRANLVYLDDSTIVADEMGSLRYNFDVGSPLVSENGVQIGVLSELTERWSIFLQPSEYRDWILTITGL
ncbi:trypsin delta-like [Maniola hyperantus]|uniref:trypsin delta-like n=1 Tax=Aphantopus hyperantus TaxID=2795564 RepID=UPI001569F155|nr:acrosin-like [Maniola hyperantus]